MSDVITFGATQIGDIASLDSINYDAGGKVFKITADKQSSDAKAFLTYFKNLLTTVGADDVQVVSIPRAKGVRIYANVTKENLTVYGTNYGKTACKSGKIKEYHANGYGVFELEFIGSQ